MGFRPLSFPVAALCLALGAASGPSPAAPSGVTVRVVGEEGEVFEWRDRQGAHAASLSVNEDLGTVKFLAAYAGGTRLLALTGNPEDPGRGRKRREGVAVIYAAATVRPRAIHQIPIPGEGYAGTVTADGRRAYVLAYRPGSRRAPGAGRPWVHELDLENGVLESTLTLDSPAASIAVQPDGRRLFLSLADRIQTCNTGPLRVSWFYRSPGVNGGLYFPPGKDVLYVLRGKEIALFDPRAILARPTAERQRLVDDATAVIQLPGAAAALVFSEDGDLAFAYHAGPPLFIDLRAGEALEVPDLSAAVRQARLIRPLRFPAGGDLRLALFPDARVETVRRPPLRHPPRPRMKPPPPVLESPPHSEPPPPAPGPPQPTPEPPPRSPETSHPHGEPPPATPGPTPPPVAPIVASPTDEGAGSTGAVLEGRLTGLWKRTAALVLYGPDSIIKERVRVTPGPEGRWSIPLPPPGTYRLVPIGEGSLAIPSRPNFHTILVREGSGRGDLDFEILPPP